LISNSIISEQIEIAGERLTLLSEKAIVLADHDVILVSDLHFGKVDHFRKNGIGLPASAARKDIYRLEKLINDVDVNHIVFLGDLFHSDYNDAWIDFREMLTRNRSRKFTLVVGNHDILEASQYEGVSLTKQLDINNLRLTHEPLDEIIEGKYNLCGHIHPGVRLKGKGKQSLRLPCFYFGQDVGIMPAYGTFTGTHVLKPEKGDRVFVVQKELILEVTA